MNLQEQRQQVQALRETVQTMSAWIQMKKSVLDAYSWKIQDLRRQLRKRNWSRGSAPTLTEELHQVQLRYSNLSESLQAEQLILAEKERMLNEYRQGKSYQPADVRSASVLEPVSGEIADRALLDDLDLSDQSNLLSDQPTSILEPSVGGQMPDPNLAETNSELFFQELALELQTLTTPDANPSVASHSVDLQASADVPQSDLLPSDLLHADWAESSVELPQFDRLHLEEEGHDLFAEDFHLPDVTLAHLNDTPSTSTADGDFTGTFKSQPQLSADISPQQSERDGLRERQVHEVQQQIQGLEATIQKMCSWIDQQQEELASYAWTIQDLRDRLKAKHLNLQTSLSIRQELDYVLQQHSSLEQSIQVQRQKFKQAQQQLDNAYEQLARIQSEQALGSAITQTKAWVQQQQEELDAHNWKIQELRYRLTHQIENPRATLELQLQLDNALEQYSALEHSLYLQRQKLAEQQQRLKALGL